MRSFVSLLAAGLLTASSVRCQDAASDPKRFIIEFDPGTNPTDLTSSILSSPPSGNSFKLLRSFNSKTFTGISVESTISSDATSDTVTHLEAIPAVAKVWRSTLLRLEKQPVEDSQLRVQLSEPDDASAKNYSIHAMTGVDQLHAQGVFGKGVKVGVVDTGIAWGHPALGGCFGPGCKVAGGWDFIGNSTYPTGDGAKQPDSDPNDEMGHGTHVAGIVAGKSDAFTGVAPEATLYGYKVFGTVDAVWDDDVIDGFLRAEADGVDIITASIIGYSGWSENAWAVVGSRLVERGFVVICAAGNWGSSAGPFFHSSGASGEFVLSVASVEASQRGTPALEATFTAADGTSNTTKIAYYREEGPFPRSLTGLPIVSLSGDPTVENEACDTLPPTTPNLGGAVVLVRRGGCLEFQKQANLEAFGAQYMLFYNDDEPIGDPFFVGESKAAVIEARAGQAIIKAIAAGGNVTASFDLDPLSNNVGILDPVVSGKPSDFSSWGGLYDLQIKPDIAAPGGRIFSTALNGGYATLSGTSQAAPYIAGVAALWIGEHGGRSVHGPGFAKKLIAKIIHSGSTISGATRDWVEYGFMAPVIQMGNGLVDAVKVVNYKTSLSYAKFALNDTAHFKPSHSVDITNDGASPVTYSFGFIPAAGFELWTPYSPDVNGSPKVKDSWSELLPKSMVPQISFSPPSGTDGFVVQPGETRTATVVFDYPRGLSNVPAYSGKILVIGDNGEMLSVPYFGIASDLKAEINKQYRSEYPKIWSGPEWPYATIEEKNRFTFNLSLAAGDYPQVHAMFQWGVRELRWDIFEADWTESQWNYPPTPGQNGYVGSVAYYADSGGDQGRHYRFDPATDDENDVVPFPERLLYRSAPNLVFESQFWWLGKMSDGTRIPVGNYTMRFAALLPFGEPTVSEDWDKAIHKFEILPL